jgi:hypothetical protein
MPRAKIAELSTFEWTTLTDTQIRDRGCSPLSRVCYTGHKTFIRRQYVASIGKWGALETSDMISEDAPHNAMLHVSVSAYHQFKARHSLMTKSQFERHHGPHPWTRAELCFTEQARAQRALGVANGITWANAAPIGTACAYAVATARVDIGLLPIEVVLWSSLFGDFLLHHGIRVDDWLELITDDKQLVWELGCDGVPWDVAPLADAPARLHVPDVQLAAA